MKRGVATGYIAGINEDTARFFEKTGNLVTSALFDCLEEFVTVALGLRMERRSSHHPRKPSQKYVCRETLHSAKTPIIRKWIDDSPLPKDG